jgi:uncharacterized protein related to proFAR isomerase
VVANCVELVPSEAVGAVGIPDKKIESANLAVVTEASANLAVVIDKGLKSLVSISLVITFPVTSVCNTPTTSQYFKFKLLETLSDTKLKSDELLAVGLTILFTVVVLPICIEVDFNLIVYDI